LKICRVQAIALKLRKGAGQLGSSSEASVLEYFREPPYRSLYSPFLETLLVRVETDEGYIGWGEALAPVAPEVVAVIVDRLLAPQLVGQDPTGVRPLTSMLRELMRERGHLTGHQADAVAACDIALWDLAGRIAGVPVSKLLGGAFRSTIPTYVSGLGDTPEASADMARYWFELGSHRVKLHLGFGVEEDLHHYDRVSETCPSLQIAVDAHWSYDLAGARRLGAALDERGAWFFEAPLEPEDIEGHGELARTIRTPLAVGEALRNRYEFGTWLRAGAVAICQPDVARAGISEATVIADLAAAQHRQVAPHHSVGLGVALAAGLQLSAALENLATFEYQPETVPAAQRILRSPIGGGPGYFELPPGPGLGVDVDEGVVAELAEGLR
jgi:D-galactarolactone cycloisomerase